MLTSLEKLSLALIIITIAIVITIAIAEGMLIKQYIGRPRDRSSEPSESIESSETIETVEPSGPTEQYALTNGEVLITPSIYNPASGRNYNLAKQALNETVFNPTCNSTISSLPINTEDLTLIKSSGDDDLYATPFSVGNIKTNIGIGQINRAWNDSLSKYDTDLIMWGYEKMFIPNVNKLFESITSVPYSDFLLSFFDPWPYKPIKNIIYGPRTGVFQNSIVGIVIQRDSKSKDLDKIELYNDKQRFVLNKVEERGNWLRFSLGNKVAQEITAIRFLDKNDKEVYNCNDKIVWAIY